MNDPMQPLSTPATGVLIVDDNKQYTRVLEILLRQGFGYSDIAAVHSPDEALVLIAQDPERFKVLFVDYNFPTGDSGSTLLNKLKQSHLLEDKVAFLITAEPTVDNQREAMNAGARGVVAKPFDRKKIKEQLEKAERSLAMDKEESF